MKYVLVEIVDKSFYDLMLIPINDNSSMHLRGNICHCINATELRPSVKIVIAIFHINLL